MFSHTSNKISMLFCTVTVQKYILILFWLVCLQMHWNGTLFSLASAAILIDDLLSRFLRSPKLSIILFLLFLG